MSRRRWVVVYIDWPPPLGDPAAVRRWFWRRRQARIEVRR